MDLHKLFNNLTPKCILDTVRFDLSLICLDSLEFCFFRAVTVLESELLLEPAFFGAGYDQSSVLKGWLSSLHSSSLVSDCSQAGLVFWRPE